MSDIESQQEAKVRLCAYLGHSYDLVVPMEKEPRFRKVRIACSICGEGQWTWLDPEMWGVFEADVLRGKFV